MTRDFDAQVAGVAALGDPVRRSLYRFVVASPEPVSREQAATAVGIQKALAAHHLEKLVDEGLLDFEFRRLTGRSGPGAGRPAKLYRRSDREIEVSLPPREYDLAGRLLAEAIETASTTGADVRAALDRAAGAFGESMGDEARARAGARPSRRAQLDALLEVLRDHGFEPRVAGDDVVLANCPFHALSERFTGLVCGMNLQLLEGVHRALGLGPRLQPRLEPEAGQCCVKFCG